MNNSKKNAALYHENGVSVALNTMVHMCPYEIHPKYMQLDREKLVLVLLVISTISLWFLKTFLENVIYTKTFPYEQTEQQIKVLHDKNMNLKDKLLQDSSYTKISREAAKEGYAPASVIYLR